MGGPRFPQLVESYSGFIYLDLDIFIGAPLNADYTEVIKRRYFLKDGMTGLLLVQLTFSMLVLPGMVEHNLKWGGSKIRIFKMMFTGNGRRRREFLEESGGILPQKILKSRVSEMLFSAFSTRYFVKK